MNTIKEINQINRNTPEGKLLWAAMIELTTKLYPKETPFDVLDRLAVIAEREGLYGNNSQSRSCVAVSKPFEKAISESIQKSNEQQKKKIGEIINAGETIFSYAVCSMNPDDYNNLEGLLVKLYRHYAKV